MENVCPYCHVALRERGSYCYSCGGQARCKSCQAILGADDPFCVECGIAAGSNSPTSVSGGATSTAVNTVEFDETAKTRSIRAKLTDESVGHLSSALGLFMGGRLPPSANQRRHPLAEPNPTDAVQPPLLEQSTDAVFTDEALQEPKAPAVERTLTEPESDKERLGDFFRRDGEQLKLDDSRLKAKGKLDFAKRLTVLFLYTHEQNGRNSIPRAELNAVLTKESVYDSNLINWLNNTSELRVENDQIELKKEGREHAKQVLAEALDPNAKNAWTPDAAPRTKSVKSEATLGDNSKTESKPAPTKPNVGKVTAVAKDVAEWLSKWKSLDLKIDGHTIIKDRKTAEKGIFGLWAIRRAMGDDAKIVSRTKLASFLYEGFEVKVDDRSLEDALKADGVKDKVLNVRGTMFQILPPGTKYAAQMAGMNEPNPAHEEPGKGATKP